MQEATGPTASGTPVRRHLPLVAWAATLAVAIVLLLSLGGGQLATPSVTDPGAWGGWLAARDPVVAAAAILRLVVLGVAWYLVGITTVSLVAHLARAARLVRIADALSVPIVRRVVQQAVGVTLAGAVLSTSVAASPAATSVLAGDGAMTAAAPSDRIDMVALDDGDGPVVAMVPEATEAGVVAMARLPDVAAPDAATPDAAVATHEVVAGDHLWSIAEDALAAAWGRPPSDAEVAPYWRVVIAANRDVLATPDDPDLIFPGQVVTLPPPPAAPGTT